MVLVDANPNRKEHGCTLTAKTYEARVGRLPGWEPRSDVQLLARGACLTGLGEDAASLLPSLADGCLFIPGTLEGLLEVAYPWSLEWVSVLTQPYKKIWPLISRLCPWICNLLR